MRAPTAVERSQDDMVSGGDESSYKYFDEQITWPTRTGPHPSLAMRTRACGMVCQRSNCFVLTRFFPST